MANSVQEVSFVFNPLSPGSKQIFVNVVGILFGENVEKLGRMNYRFTLHVSKFTFSRFRRSFLVIISFQLFVGGGKWYSFFEYFSAIILFPSQYQSLSNQYREQD